LKAASEDYGAPPCSGACERKTVMATLADQPCANSSDDINNKVVQKSATRSLAVRIIE